MALDLRLHKEGSDVSSGSSSSLSPSPDDKQVTLNIPKVGASSSGSPLASSDLSNPLALALSLGIPLDYTASLYNNALVDNSTDIKPFTIQPISEAEENAVQKELNKLKDDWSKYRTEMTSPKPRRFDGSRGIGWTTIGDVIVPYIMRGPCKYVSTKIVESKLLQPLQGVNLEKMSHAGPLYSYYITEQEARLFTEINAKCYNNQFGSEAFTTQDLIVSLTEFEQFYNNLRKQCGVSETPKKVEGRGPGRPKRNSLLTSMPHLIQDFNDSSSEGVEGGWVQINNTVVPYVFRNGVKFTPLCIIKYSAGLLNDVRIDGYKTPCTEMEYQYLNQSCRTLGLDFSFLKSTKLIKLELVIRLSSCKVTIKELPTEDPFSQASFQSHVREPLLAYPLTSSSPDLAPDQNPALFQIQSPLNIAGTSVDTFNLFNPATAIASHALQFFNAAGPSLLQCFKKETNPLSSSASLTPSLASIATVAPVSIPRSSPSTSQYSLVNSIQSSANSSTATQQQNKIAKAASTTSSSSSSIPPSSRILSDPTRKLPTFSKSKQRSLKSSHLVSNPLTRAPIVGHPNKIVIECVEFQGKTLPCLLRGGVPENSFVLVESVMRLFFPQTTLDKFIDVLQGVMNVTIVHLRSVEEQAFIRFYNLPVKAMRYKYMMMFQELQHSFPNLKNYFDTLSKNVDSNVISNNKVKKSASPVLTHNRTPSPKGTNNNVKLETSESNVCYVMDNQLMNEDEKNVKDKVDSKSISDLLIKKNDSKDEKRSSENKLLTNDIDIEVCNQNENADADIDSTETKEESEMESDSNDIHIEQSLKETSKNDLSSDEEETVETKCTHDEDSNVQRDMSSSDSKKEELAMQEDTRSTILQKDEVDKENKCTYSKPNDDIDSNVDDNHNEERDKKESNRKRRHDSGSDSGSPVVTEKRMKNMNVNKLESALAKLKQRQQEKLVSTDGDG